MSELPNNLQESLGANYRIERDLGGGGMSHVFVAHDEILDRDIVVKLLHRDLVDAVDLERFSREVRLAARLSHPHIVPLLTAGESYGRPFYTMPLVDGESLRDRLDGHQELSIAESIRILRDVASALGYAHAQGVVHRDIKPDNVLLTGDSAAVTDFGVAKALSLLSPGATQVTATGLSLGTPAYMAPEQAAGESSIDGRADLYALGVMAFEMFCGHCPFDGRTLQATLIAHITESPPDIRSLRVDLPERLSELIMRCLAKDPGERPQHASGVVNELDSLADPTMKSAFHSTSALKQKQKVRNTRIVDAAVASVLVVAAFIYAAREYSSATTNATESSLSASASAVSVAVLPFGGGNDTTDSYLREGIAEQLMEAIGRVRGVRVASRMSTFALEGRSDMSTEEVGKKLNVQNVLEGTVRRDGDRLRVFVQLSSAKDGGGLWSKNYEFDKANLFSVQDSISTEVLDRLRVESAGSSEPVTLSGIGTHDLEAYDLYLRARYQFNKFDEGPLRESIKLYDEALQRDTRFANAWSGIASSWLFLADDYVAPRIAYPAVRRAAEQALSLDSTIADAHASRGSALFSYFWQFAEGRQEIERAVALAPSSFIVLLSHQALLVAEGKPDSALRVLRSGQESDPLSPLNALLLGRFLGIVGRYDDAIAQYRRVVELAPPLAPFALLPIAEAQIAEGNLTEGESTLKQVREMLPPTLHFLLAYAEAGLGHTEVAYTLLAQYEAVAKRQYVRPELIAMVYARLGNRDAAIAWLDKSFEAHSPYLFALAVDKQWDTLRPDPRFVAMVERMRAVTKAP